MSVYTPNKKNSCSEILKCKPIDYPISVREGEIGKGEGDFSGNELINVITSNELQKSKLLERIKEGSENLTHVYLDTDKPYIDKLLLVEAGVRLSGDDLIYTAIGLINRKPLQFQVIKPERKKGKIVKNTRCHAESEPVVHIFGSDNLTNAYQIILCESLTKACAIYQSINYQGTYSVINCINAGNLVKVAKHLSAIEMYKGKVIIAADNDDPKKDNVTSDGYLRMIKDIAIECQIPITKPVKNIKDWDDWLSAGKFAEDEIFTQINSASLIKTTHVNTQNTFNYFKGFSGYDVEIDYLIKNYLPSNSMGQLYGPSGEFKSFLAISWACHIATGKAWNGYKVDPAGVLYVVGEGGIGAPRRFKAWADQYNDTEEIPNLFYLKQPVHVANTIQALQLTETIKLIKSKEDIDIKLVVLDTLARCFIGDENRASEMGAFISGCDEVKAETGATILIIHHSGKDKSKESRGSNSLPAACDFEYKVKRIDKENNGLELVLANTKLKDGEPHPKEAFRLNKRIVHIDSDGEEVTSLTLIDEGYEPPEDEPRTPNDTTQQILLTIIKSQDGPVSNNFLNDEYYHRCNPELNQIEPEVAKKEKAKLRQQKKRAMDQLLMEGIVVSDKGYISLI